MSDNLPPLGQPRAWALPIPEMAGGGDYLRSAPSSIEETGLAWEPLYDRACVAAERERCAEVMRLSLHAMRAALRTSLEAMRHLLDFQHDSEDWRLARLQASAAIRVAEATLGERT